MLTRIGDSLAAWKPRGNAAGDPLATIRSAWLGLVGADVARAAAPVAIAQDALIVITTSSAWSHQLSFLEARIVAQIRAVVPSVGIARLRFRVGTLRAAVPHGPLPHAPGPTPSRERPRSTPVDAAEALARFRASVERARARHRFGGGSFCIVCDAPVPRAGTCVPCTDWHRSELRARCQRLLFDAPWLQPEDVLGMLPGLDASSYDRIRRDLLRAWWDEMNVARKRAALPRPIAPDRMRLRKIASSFVLLETKLDPNRLDMDSPIRRNALGDLYEFIRGVEAVDPSS
jgi:hypothetical protein